MLKMSLSRRDSYSSFGGVVIIDDDVGVDAIAESSAAQHALSDWNGRKLPTEKNAAAVDATVCVSILRRGIVPFVVGTVLVVAGVAFIVKVSPCVKGTCDTRTAATAISIGRPDIGLIVSVPVVVMVLIAFVLLCRCWSCRRRCDCGRIG